jgi:hypothetical protein
LEEYNIRLCIESRLTRSMAEFGEHRRRGRFIEAAIKEAL